MKQPAQFKVEVVTRSTNAESEARLLQAIFGVQPGCEKVSPPEKKELVVVQRRGETISATNERAWAEGLAAKTDNQDVFVTRF